MNILGKFFPGIVIFDMWHTTLRGGLVFFFVALLYVVWRALSFMVVLVMMVAFNLCWVVYSVVSVRFLVCCAAWCCFVIGVVLSWCDAFWCWVMWYWIVVP